MAPRYGSGTGKSPKPPLEAIAADEERREKAKTNLVRALQSYLNKLDSAPNRDAHRETELFCDYARANYSSRAEPYFEVMPQMDPGVLFRMVEKSEQEDLSDLSDLSGLPTVGDVLELAKSIKVRRPKNWPDGPIYRDGETAEMRRVIRQLVVGKHVSFKWLLEEPESNWFRQQIRECVTECVREKRAAYERRFPAEPKPFPADHPAHQVWKELSREAREALSRLFFEYQCAVSEFDQAFQERFAETPSLDLLERYCLGRFDLLASQLLPGSKSPDPTCINPRYESYLDTLLQKQREYPRKVLGAMRSEVREEIVSRITLKLSSRKLYWMREAMNWRLQGYPLRSPSGVNLDLSKLSAIGPSLDDLVKRIADEFPRNGGVENVAGTIPATTAVVNDQKADANVDGRVGDPVAGERVIAVKKRGRPQRIADENKTAAVKLKQSGGTNAQAAALIYGTKYPSPQQKKNVSSILRHHLQKSKRPDSSVAPSKSSPKPHKTKG